MYIDLNKQNIYYQRVGKGQNLVLLHGWGQDVSTFWPVIELLKDNFTLWLIDLPGFGRSEAPTKAFDSKDYAQIIAEFIAVKNIHQPILLGHSFGGKVSLKLAATYPNLIKKLILVGASGIKTVPSFKTLIVYIVAKAARLLIPNIFNLKTIIKKKLYQKIESDYESSGILKDTFLKTIQEDLTADLKKINTETLIIWGEKDRAVPLKYGKMMYKLIKNSKLAVLEDRGHFLHLQDPERFVYYVKDFA